MINLIYSNLNSVLASRTLDSIIKDKSSLNLIFCDSKQNIKFEKKINNRYMKKLFPIKIYIKNKFIKKIIQFILINSKIFKINVQIFNNIGFNIYRKNKSHRVHTLINNKNHLSKFSPLYNVDVLDFLKYQIEDHGHKKTIIIDCSRESQEKLLKAHDCQGAYNCVILLAKSFENDIINRKICKNIHLYSTDKHDFLIIQHLLDVSKIIYGKGGTERFPLDFYQSLGIPCFYEK